jgi:hypothetical protein
LGAVYLRVDGDVEDGTFASAIDEAKPLIEQAMAKQ